MIWSDYRRVPEEKASIMPMRMVFTALERERMGVLVNNTCIYATQLINHDGPDFSTRALVNLVKVKKENEELLRRLDELARQQRDESPLRLIQDLASTPITIGQMLSVVRRCLAASAFIGHCMAQPDHPGIASETLSQEKHLH
jgi:hypothetical protein